LIIVDSYCHLGECRVYDQIIFENEIINALTSNQISAAIVAPFPGAPNPAKVHDDIASLGTRYPGRVFGLANVNPHINRDNFRREVERCVRELGFVGVVLDTAGHAVNPNGRDGQTVFEIGRELTVPVVVHTGTGLPFGLPSAVLPRARAYSDVKIVLAHAGATLFTFEAQTVAREAPNVFLGTSYCRGEDVKAMTSDIGANRLLFASDLPGNQSFELAKLRSLNLFQFQQLQVFAQNAIDLFALKGVPDLAEPVPAAEG
jgi:predicted TIM-barrel fold metal-dependent hydrolase